MKEQQQEAASLADPRCAVEGCNDEVCWVHRTWVHRWAWHDHNAVPRLAPSPSVPPAATDDTPLACGECYGTGSVRVQFNYGVQEQDCDECNGTGVIMSPVPAATDDEAALAVLTEVGLRQPGTGIVNLGKIDIDVTASWYKIALNAGWPVVTRRVSPWRDPNAAREDRTMTDTRARDEGQFDEGYALGLVDAATMVESLIVAPIDSEQMPGSFYEPYQANEALRRAVETIRGVQS